MEKPGEMKIAVIGGGISGIATAQILKKNGFTPVVFEKSSKPGGVWATAYPGVHLQNIYSHYHLTDFPWPSKPDFHPSGKQIYNYLALAIEKLELDVRLQHEVVAMLENSNGWNLEYLHNNIRSEEQFGFVIICTGHYTQPKVRPHYEGEDIFEGQIITELDVKDIAQFDGKDVAINGFGKSALDMTTFAVGRATSVHHVFRSPRWMIQEQILGMHYTRALFNRFGTIMMRSWVQPTAFERFLHRYLKFAVTSFWKMVGAILRHQLKKHGRGKGEMAKQRLSMVQAKHSLINDLGSKSAIVPDDYLPYVADGKIIPHHAAIKSFTNSGMVLNDGSIIPCNVVMLCLGSDTPQFPYLPEKYRKMLETKKTGTQLYRHLIHPEISNLAFCGFNHGFLHVPTIEAGTQWICAMIKGELELPVKDEMLHCMQETENWKLKNINHDPAMAYATSTRYHQYLDVILKDIGISPYRKLPNFFAEIFSPYTANDYKGITEAYLKKAVKRKTKLRPLKVNT
jgi:dimethylaniline monooxygenase (N-oxide forming)